MNAFIKELMDNHEITQKELAAILGISPQAISQWNKTENIKPEYLYALAKLFGISIDEILSEQLNIDSLEKFIEDCIYKIYNISEIDIGRAISEENTDQMIEYTEKVKKATEKFYPLLYKKISNTISKTEKIEFDYIRDFFEPNTAESLAFADFDITVTKEHDIDSIIGTHLIEKFGIKDENSIIWELKKIYRCTKIINLEDWFDETVINNIYDSYPDIYHDKDATELYYNKDYDAAYELVHLGARILYNDKSLPSENFDYNELEKFEGEKKPLKHLDTAKELIMQFYGLPNYYQYLYYNDYQKIINKNAIRRVKAYHAYFEKSPYKFWEYLKKEQY